MPVEKSTIEFIKNLKLTVNKIHIRLEDDLLSTDQPYSLSLVIHVRCTHLNIKYRILPSIQQTKFGSLILCHKAIQSRLLLAEIFCRLRIT